MEAYVAARLAERSTWTGIGVLITSVGPAVASHDYAAVGQAVIGLLAILIPGGK